MKIDVKKVHGRKLSWNWAGLVLEAQALPRERVPHAAASSFKNGHPRDRITQIFGKMQFKQRVVRMRGCTRATSTNQVTRSRDSRVRVA